VRRLKKALAVVGAGVAGTLLVAAPAFAGSISAPTGNPYNWPGDSNGQPIAHDVSFTGFNPNSNIFIEQCDGTDPATTPNWDPTEHCDSGTSPAALKSDGSGNGTFLASDANHAFTPVKGESPQSLFICKGPNDPDPANPNQLPIYTNCRIRVSSNNAAPTPDQAFLVISLPDTVAQTPEVPYAVILPIGALGIGGSYFVIRKRRSARAAA